MTFRFPTNSKWRPNNISTRNAGMRPVTYSGMWGQSLRVACGPYPPPVFGEVLGYPPSSGDCGQYPRQHRPSGPDGYPGGHGPGGGNAWGPESYLTPTKQQSNKALINILREKENPGFSTRDDERRREEVGMNGSSDGRIQPLMGSGRGELERQDFSKVTGMGGGKYNTRDFSGTSSIRDFTRKSSMIDSGMGGMSSGFDLRATSSMNTMKNSEFGSGIGGNSGSRPRGMGNNSYPTGQSQFQVSSKSKQLLIKEVKKKRASETAVFSSNAKRKGSDVDRIKARGEEVIKVIEDRGDSLDDSFMVSSSLQKRHSTSAASLPSRQQQTQATPSPLEKLPDHRSRKSAEPEDETERMRAELLRKEKELIDIKRKLLDVQIAEARGQMNTGATTAAPPPPANNPTSTSTITSSTSSTKKADPGLEAEVRVQNISDYVTEKMVREHFGKCGDILVVYVPQKKDGSRHLLFSTKEEAEICMTLNGTEFKRRKIEVSWARVKLCNRQDSPAYIYCSANNICVNFNTNDDGCTNVECKVRHICLWCHQLNETTEAHRSRFDCPNKTGGYVDYPVSQV